MRGKSLPSLTSLRFFAAAIVALHHLYHIPVAGQYTSTPFGPGKLGFIGVTFFFVLSGFVLTWTWKEHEKRRLFYLRRVARVYPLSILVMLIALAFYAARIEPSTFHGFGLSFVAKAVACLALVQTWIPKGDFHQAFNGPMWSLSNEVFFYLLFPFLVPLLRRFRPHSVIAGALIWLIGLGLVGQIIGPAKLYSFPPYRIGEFVIGIALALAIQRGARVRLPLWAGAATAVGTYVAFLVIDSLTHGLLLGNNALTGALTAPAFGALIWAAAGHDLSGKTGFLHWQPLIKLGQWSFALYLIHDLAYRSIAHFVMPATHTQRVLIGLAVLVAAQLVAGALYEFYERPIERAIRNRLHQGESQIARMDATVQHEPHRR